MRVEIRYLQDGVTKVISREVAAERREEEGISCGSGCVAGKAHGVEDFTDQSPVTS